MKKLMLVAGVMATAGWLGLAQCTMAQQPPRPGAAGGAPEGAAQPPAGAQGQLGQSGQPGAQGQLGQRGQPGPRGGQAHVSMNPKNDQEFIIFAATRDAMERQEGQMAAEKAPSQQVRQFGQMLATDHGRNLSKAVALARQMGVQLPRGMAPEDRQAVNEFNRLRGPQFDQQFVQKQVKDHRHSIKVFEHFAKNAKDPEIKQYAEQTLPALRRHLKMAEQLSSSNRGTHNNAEEQSTPPSASEHHNALGANHHPSNEGSKSSDHNNKKSDHQSDK